MIITLKNKREIYLNKERGEKLKELLASENVPEFIVIDQIMVSKTMIAMIEPGGIPPIVENLVAIESPKNDPNKTEAIRAFTKEFINKDPSKLLNEDYRRQWIARYKNESTKND